MMIHVTYARHLDAILERGLKSGSYLTNLPAVAAYYAEGILEEGSDYRAIAIDLDLLLGSVGEQALHPDNPSIQEPITTALGKGMDEVDSEWANSPMDWRSSLEIVGSVRVDALIPPELLRDCTHEIQMARRPSVNHQRFGRYS